MRVLDDDLDRMDREKLITDASACAGIRKTARVQVMNFVWEASWEERKSCLTNVKSLFRILSSASIWSPIGPNI